MQTVTQFNQSQICDLICQQFGYMASKLTLFNVFLNMMFCD